MHAITVLIVENDPIQSNLLQDQLEALNYEVLQAVTTGEEALEAVQDQQPDIVIMDIELDGNLNGIETANQIYDQYQIPIIYLSQFQDLKTYRNAKRKIRAQYVPKPLSVIGILNALDTLLKEQMEDPDTTPSKIDDRIFVKNGNGHYAVFMKDIIYIEANREVSVIYHTQAEKPSTVGLNLGSLEKKLKPFDFIARCSRHHMVNLKRVNRIKDKAIENPTTGRESIKKVLEVDQHTIVISDKYKSQITSRFYMH
jgi:DNA-binding LytR/AlgR family response regulator